MGRRFESCRAHQDFKLLAGAGNRRRSTPIAQLFEKRACAATISWVATCAHLSNIICGFFRGKLPCMHTAFNYRQRRRESWFASCGGVVMLTGTFGGSGQHKSPRYRVLTQLLLVVFSCLRDVRLV